MKAPDQHKESIGARGEDCASHGWARHAPASGYSPLAPAGSVGSFSGMGTVAAGTTRKRGERPGYLSAAFIIPYTPS